MDIIELQKGIIPDNAQVREFVVPNRLGLHARPAALLVKATRDFDCEVFIERDGTVVDGKSIMGVMMIGAGLGVKLRFIAVGKDAELLLDAVGEIFNRNFEEE